MEQVNRRIQVGDVLQREVALESTAFDRKSRILRMSFASETPVYRYEEHEILSCRAGDVDMSRIKNGAPLLKNHDSKQLIGAVLRASVDDDKVCRCEVRLSRRCESNGDADDIEDGILQKVSVGYSVTRVIEETANPNDPNGAPFVRYAWRPFEVSLVSIPADDSVGVGRSADPVAGAAPVVSADEPEAPVVNPEPTPVVEKDGRMEVVEKVEVLATPAAGAVEVKQADVKAERAEIARLGKQHKLAGLAERALVEGWNLEQFRKEAMNEMEKDNGKVQDPSIGLSPAEVKRYSFMNVVRALAGERVDIGFERECSDSVSKKVGRSARGLFVPFEVQHSRDLQIASPGTGSNVVATNLMSGSFIEALRAKLALQALGVPVMGGLVGDVAIPKGTTATGYWVDETTAPTESTPVLSQVTGTPRAVGGLVHISRKLLKQSSVDVEGFVRNEIAVALATKIDQAAFNGAGTNEPVGLLTGPISTDVAMTAGSATYANIADMLATVEGKNVGLDSVKWAVTSEVFWKLATTATSTNGPRFVADYDTGLILGRPAVVSSNVTANYGFVGDWSQMMLLMWGNGLDLTVDPYSASTTGLLKVVGFMDVDIIVRQADAFAHADITT